MCRQSGHTNVSRNCSGYKLVQFAAGFDGSSAPSVAALCRQIGLICKSCRPRHSHKQELVSDVDSLFKE